MNSDKISLAVRLYDEKQHTIELICQMMDISKPIFYKDTESERAAKSKP